MYVVAWLFGFNENSLGAVYEKDLFAGVFYSLYGLNDFVFMLFFAWVFLTQRKPFKSVA